jgi:hypothetical protein
MICIEIEKQDPFPEQAVQILSQIEGWEIETAHLKVVAVGMAIAGHPPHRSVREELPHTALAASRSRKRISG